MACRREKPLWVSSRKKTRNLETCKNQTHRLSARTARLTLLRRDLAISGRCGFCCCCCSSSSNERRFRDLMKQGKKKRKVSKVIRVRFFLSQKKVERKKKNSFVRRSTRFSFPLFACSCSFYPSKSNQTMRAGTIASGARVAFTTGDARCVGERGKEIWRLSSSFFLSLFF